MEIRKYCKNKVVDEKPWPPSITIKDIEDLCLALQNAPPRKLIYELYYGTQEQKRNLEIMIYGKSKIQTYELKTKNLMKRLAR
jgi:hypothetical protein